MGYKISDLLGASLPLSGNELLEVTQDESSRRVRVSDLLPGFDGDTLGANLADQADSTKGGSLVGMNGASLRGFYGEKVSLESFGAVPGGDATAAFAMARAALTGTDKVLHLPNAVYQITSTIRLDGLNVYSDGCRLQKNFNGIGIEIQGGADYFDFEGTMYLNGIGAGFYDPVANPGPPANPNAHGVWFNGARIRVRGKILAQNHQGDGFRFTCSGNMNKTNINACWAWWCHRGHYFEGSQDDFSVCEIKLYSQFTWKEGIATSPTFMGRQWKCFWYNESAALDGISDGVSIGKLRTSDLFIYSENQSTTGRDVYVSSQCDLLLIEEGRGGNVVSECPSAQFTIGGQSWPKGNTPVEVVARFTPPVSSANLMTKRVLGRSLAILADHMYRADGQYTSRVNNVGTANSWNEHGVRYDRELHQSFGLRAITSHYAALGTPDAPTAFAVGAIIQDEDAYGYTGAAYAQVWRRRVVADHVGSGNKMGCREIVSLANSSGSSAVDMYQLLPTGDIELLLASAGIIVKTPDGTKRYRIGVSNAGAVTATLL